jgi:hypothetical protein
VIYFKSLYTVCEIDFSAMNLILQDVQERSPHFLVWFLFSCLSLKASAYLQVLPLFSDRFFIDQTCNWNLTICIFVHCSRVIIFDSSINRVSELSIHAYRHCIRYAYIQINKPAIITFKIFQLMVHEMCDTDPKC